MSKSLAKVVRIAATDLTTSFVYNTGVVIDGLDQHTLLISYDPDENDGVLHVVVEASQQDDNTADASCDWVPLCGVDWTAASPSVGTAYNRELRLSASAAGTKVHRQLSLNLPGYKIRVGVKESFTGGGSNAGNALITLFSNSASGGY